MIEKLEKMLAQGRDSSLLRFSLGNEYLKVAQLDLAIGHYQEALRHDPAYSAAWKMLGKALTEAGRLQEGLESYRQGISVAEAKGDKQAAKEMTVFARRIETQLATGNQRS
jgi:predicted Zn-dependent protease